MASSADFSGIGASPWKRVVCAADCIACECCGEPYCEQCDQHYADCDCPGPTQDGYQYQEVDGVLYAAPQDEVE